MNRIGTWSFALFIGVLAYADWFAHDVPADGQKEEMPGVQVDGVKITASCKDVIVGDVTERHAFLELIGDGKGTVKVMLEEVNASPMARMIPPPTTVWTKDISFNTAESRTVDLGKVPEPDSHLMRSIVAVPQDSEFGGGIVLTRWQKPWTIESEESGRNSK